jgi:hypothetical protein
LTNPDKNLLALKSLAFDPVAAAAVSEVLYAVYDKQPVGLVTIMADLSHEEYEVLRPKHCGVSVLELWEAFEEVVNKVLVPIAARRMIHADIRPGWNVTSNILCQLVDSKQLGGRKRRVTMQVIDFESVVTLMNWVLPTNDHRYINREQGWNAFTYLWWQCANLAHAWHAMLLQEDMITFDLRAALEEESWKAEWFRGVDVPEDIELTIESFQIHFDSLRNKFSYCPKGLQVETENPTDSKTSKVPSK